MNKSLTDGFKNSEILKTNHYKITARQEFLCLHTSKRCTSLHSQRAVIREAVKLRKGGIKFSDCKTDREVEMLSFDVFLDICTLPLETLVYQ